MSVISLLEPISNSKILSVKKILLSTSIFTPSTPNNLSESCFNEKTFGRTSFSKLKPSINLQRIIFLVDACVFEVLNVYSLGNSICWSSLRISTPFRVLKFICGKVDIKALGCSPEVENISCPCLKLPMTSYNIKLSDLAS